MQTFREYHAENPAPSPPWHALMECHLQHGAVIATPADFVLARPVAPTATLAQCLDLNHWLPGSDTWFVWWTHGSVRPLIRFARTNGVRTLLFERLHAPGSLRRLSISPR